MMIEKLEWDSNFFGYPVGKCLVEDDFFFDIQKLELEARKFKLVYLFSSNKLQTDKIKLVDIKLTFHKRIKGINILADENLKTFTPDKDSYEMLERLALMSGVYSRFNIDSKFYNNEYESLYKQWIYNAVNDKKNSKVFIYKQDTEILGFVSLEKKSAHLSDIGLVSVDKNSRGKSIGSKLITFTENKALENNTRNIQVVTQQNNLPAVNLYRKCGYNLKNKEYVYHYWNL